MLGFNAIGTQDQTPIEKPQPQHLSVAALRHLRKATCRLNVGTDDVSHLSGMVRLLECCDFGFGFRSLMGLATR